MPPLDKHAIKILNGLVETTLDSANGYREAAENTEAVDLKTMFIERSAQREELAQQLQTEVRTLGGEPETDQSLLGKAHNKFVDLKNAMTGGSDKAVIDEVERGEDFIMAKYEHALRDVDLLPQVRRLIEEAYAKIKDDHDTVSRLKDRSD